MIRKNGFRNLIKINLIPLRPRALLFVETDLVPINIALKEELSTRSSRVKIDLLYGVSRIGLPDKRYR